MRTLLQILNGSHVVAMALSLMVCFSSVSCWKDMDNTLRLLGDFTDGKMLPHWSYKPYTGGRCSFFGNLEDSGIVHNHRDIYSM